MENEKNCHVFLKTEDVESIDVEATRVTVRAIAAEVSELMNVPIHQIFGLQRVKRICLARQMVCFIAYRNGMSYPQIGRALARHHTTIMNAVARERQRRKKANVSGSE